MLNVIIGFTAVIVALVLLPHISKALGELIYEIGVFPLLIGISLIFGVLLFT